MALGPVRVMEAGMVQIPFVEQVSKHCHFCSTVEYYGDNESYRKIIDIVIIIYSNKTITFDLLT